MVKDERRPVAATPIQPGTWLSVAGAAAFLGLSPERLRKTLERHARKVDGCVEATVDGVTARKFGRLWRVRFSASWTKADGA